MEPPAAPPPKSVPYITLAFHQEVGHHTCQRVFRSQGGDPAGKRYRGTTEAQVKSMWSWVAVGLLTMSAGAWFPGSVAAQATREPVEADWVLSANPFLLLAEWFNVDLERRVGKAAALDVQGSLITLDGGDEDYMSVNATYRFYPQGAALTGFYFGPKAGIHRVDDLTQDAVVFGAGFELGYNWLLGVDRNFAIGLGLGASRLFGGDLDEDSVYLPTARLVNVGWAF